jgi:Ca2+-binding RTX toxin-like protein
MRASVDVRVKAGGEGSNTTNGTSGPELLLAKSGNDTLSALGASDVLCESNGNDRLSGGGAADSSDGGAGTDTSTDFSAGEGDFTTNIP